MATDNFCFYLQSRLIQTSETGGQRYSDPPPLVFPGQTLAYFEGAASESRKQRIFSFEDLESDEESDRSPPQENSSDVDSLS
jgi:hypothetical protein